MGRVRFIIADIFQTFVMDDSFVSKMLRRDGTQNRVCSERKYAQLIILNCEDGGHGWNGGISKAISTDHSGEKLELLSLRNKDS